MFYIYKEKKINENFKLCCCMVLKNNGFAGVETKFNFQKTGIENACPEEWSNWFFAENTKNVHLWIDSVNEMNCPPLLIDSNKNLIKTYEEIFNEEFEKEMIQIKTNKILHITGKEILDKLTLIKGAELTELDKQIAFAMTLIQIAAYLDSNPEQMTEFPLYLSYIKKHKLSVDEYPVEDFINDITNAATCMEY